MDPTANDPFFDQMCQAMTPGLMTPLDDWTHSGLFNDLFNPTNGSLVQDAFLTSPCGTKDYLCLPSSPPQDLFNALSTPTVSPVPTDNNNLVPSADPFAVPPPDPYVGLIDSLVIPGTPQVASLETPSPTPASHSPLEMILTLDSPPPAKKALKRKASPPAAAQPVASHITSASTPTFALKQPTKKRSLPPSSVSPVATTTGPAVPTELALKRQKNTDAARRSRQKKLAKMETLVGRVSDLESIHHTLMSRVTSLESEKSVLIQRETDYLARIQQLEANLALAQQKLLYPSS